MIFISIYLIVQSPRSLILALLVTPAGPLFAASSLCIHVWKPVSVMKNNWYQNLKILY